ncbi:MAG TPA: hypothetical protein VLV50_04720 [Stellaceae bacterium]|nr:hypothetical protein [Stellaceae bacterium]
MPEAYLVLWGASLLAPIFLFGIAIWTGIERQLALAALERRVRERRGRAGPLATLVRLVPTGPPPLVPTPGSPRRTAA